MQLEIYAVARSQCASVLKSNVSFPKQLVIGIYNTELKVWQCYSIA